MKAGYRISHYADRDSLGRHDIDFAIQHNYNASDHITTYYGYSEHFNSEPYATPGENTVAIFRLRPKVECDRCGKLTKENEDAAGNVYCEKCEDNLNEQAAERYYNDAENFTTNDYSQYKSLK